MVAAWAAMAIFAFHACTHMVGAGDTWVALACGRHFLNHGVDTAEPFSANSHKPGPTAEDIEKWPPVARWIAGRFSLDTLRYWHPTGWINQNWLTHVLFYWLSHESPIADAEQLSFNSLVYWKFAVYALTTLCVYYTARLLGVAVPAAAAFACGAMFVGRSFLDIRPAGFSNLFVAVFMLLLVLATYRNILYIWLVVPLAVLWCNLHGGYIYLFIMLLPFMGLHWLGLFFPETFVSIGRRGLCHTAAAYLTGLAAVIVLNPFHLTNLTHTFVISASEHARMWRTVNEWHPAFEWTNPVGTGFPFLVLFMLLLVVFFLWLFAGTIVPGQTKLSVSAAQRLCSSVRWFGWATAVCAAWVVFVAFSFIDLHPWHFLLCAVFVAILLAAVRRNVCLVYGTVVLSLAALWAGDPADGYGGAYIWPFCVLPAYVIIAAVSSSLSDGAEVRPIGIGHALAAAVAALLLSMLIFNPFGLERPVAGMWRILGEARTWRPAYEGPDSLDYSRLFVILCTVNLASIALWVVIQRHGGLSPAKDSRGGRETESSAYVRPKIDPALLSIAALTVYMAVRSRRFIPIAAIAACPVAAMLLEQTARAICACRNLLNRAGLTVAPMGRSLHFFLALIATVTAVVLGCWWGFKFKYIYLDPWPTDTRLNSVFMRMTASGVKPFDACEFINENGLSGKMFNYWTEGGFIAWAQEPDPETGRIPLQLFMDGRAQAAYEPVAYERWAEIVSGGPTAGAAKLRNRRLSASDYAKIGRWLDRMLRYRDVWVVLMPTSEFDKPLVKGLDADPDWRLAFINNKQKLFVRAGSEPEDRRGRMLVEGILEGRTEYPDEFSKYLTAAHSMLEIAGNQQQLSPESLRLALKAFELRPSQFAMRQIVRNAKFTGNRDRVNDFCSQYLDDLAENRTRYVRMHGFENRLVAALVACDYLRNISRARREPEPAGFYQDLHRRYARARKELLASKRW